MTQKQGGVNIRTPVLLPPKSLSKQWPMLPRVCTRSNRENDELTRALGNPEHGGRVRGRGVGVSWKEGFSQDEDRYGYKSRKRKKDREADQIASIQRELAGLKKQMAEVLQRGKLVISAAGRSCGTGC